MEWRWDRCTLCILAPSAYVRSQNTQTMLMCQIETPAAVATAGEIAAVLGIDGLFFGPGDFAHLLGAPGAASAGKWWGTVGPTAELYQRARSLGAKLICPGGDVKTLNLGLRELVKVMTLAVATSA
jgi:4-hydroxy-2-oxoheptanedioate aldolase